MLFPPDKECLAMSQTTSTHSEPGVKPYKGIGIRMETKLMKQYREASPVNHGIQGAAVRNKDGQVELFTVGTDETVWNFYPDPTSDTSYRRADTGLKGDSVAAGVDHGGSIVVLAISRYGNRMGRAINYVLKFIENGKWKWSQVNFNFWIDAQQVVETAGMVVMPVRHDRDINLSQINLQGFEIAFKNSRISTRVKQNRFPLRTR
jgi:hypothetical protein